jgi:hypothetical protein
MHAMIVVSCHAAVATYILYDDIIISSKNDDNSLMFGAPPHSIISSYATAVDMLIMPAGPTQ